MMLRPVTTPGLHLLRRSSACIEDVLRTGNRVVNISPLRRVATRGKRADRTDRLLDPRTALTVTIDVGRSRVSYAVPVAKHLNAFSHRRCGVRSARYRLAAEAHLRADEIESRVR